MAESRTFTSSSNSCRTPTTTATGRVSPPPHPPCPEPGQAGPGVEAFLDVAGQQLVVAQGLVALDVGQPHLDQHAADVLVLELDGALGTPVQPRQQRAAVLGLAVVPAVDARPAVVTGRPGW
jgi:hypothetical protein